MNKVESKIVTKQYLFKRKEFLDKLGITDISDGDKLAVETSDQNVIVVQGTSHVWGNMEVEMK